MEPKFVHLVCHTNYSILEGANNISSLCNLAISYNMPALGLTDLNNLFGTMEFSQKVSKVGIKPIIGIQLNINYKKISGVVNLFAMNLNGYKNLLKIHDILYKNRLNDNLKSLSLNLEHILDYSDDIIFLSGGTLGFLAQAVEEKISLTEIIELISNKFTNRFYVELNRLLLPKEAELEKEFLQLALQHNLPIVATNNVYFGHRNDYEAADVLFCIGQGITTSVLDRKSPPKEAYFKTPEEMVELFSDLPEALENTILIAKRCNFMFDKRPLELPKYSDDEESLIIKEAHQGLLNRLNAEVFPLLNQEELEPTQKMYTARLDYELEIINKMGFAGYFLIVSDFIKWSKNNDIPVGPGRGSGAGSLVAWALYIVDINPIRFNLLFERFLNPDRVSMPDFDIDFCQDRRDEVIDYVREKYGQNKVAHIITFGTLQAKAAIRDAGRALGLPYSMVDNLCKKIPYSPPSKPITLRQIVTEPAIVEEVNHRKELKPLLNIALKLEGLYRNISTHAAGVVISKTDLIDIIPIYYDYATDFPSVGFTMKYVEDAGLIKFDFLALKTLTIINKTIKLVKEVNNIDIDIINISYQDENISKMLSKGDTLGIFQLESRGMVEVIKQMQPDRIEEIIAIISLYRPGPMENIPQYINIKHAREKAVYQHELMKPILEETFGIMIYQEQVMQVAQVIAGYTLAEADLLRRAMGKKDPIEMQKQREVFVAGALKNNNIDESLANTIFNLMEKFAGYGFNKSHATAYALISWQTAYLKTYYPAEFISSIMSTDVNTSKDSYKILEFIENARNYNIDVLPPSINKTNIFFSIEKDKNGNKHLRYSLSVIKGIGDNLVEFLIEEIKNGEFKSIEDFLTRVDFKLINKKQLEALIKGGVFDEFHKNRRQLFENIDNLLSYCAEKYNKKNSNQIGLFDLGGGSLNSNRLQMSEVEDWTLKEKLAFELEILSCFISEHPLSHYKDFIEKNKILTYSQSIEKRKKTSLLVGYLISTKISKSKNGTYFSTLNFYDMSSIYSITLFGEAYNRYSSSLQESLIYIIRTKNKYDENNEVKLFVDSITVIEDFINSTDVIQSTNTDNDFTEVYANNYQEIEVPNYNMSINEDIKEENLVTYNINIQSLKDIENLKNWYVQQPKGKDILNIKVNNSTFILDDKQITPESYLDLKEACVSL